MPPAPGENVSQASEPAHVSKRQRLNQKTATKASNSATGTGMIADLLALKSVDAQRGIRLFGGKQASYRKQLQRVRQRYFGAIDELQRLIAEKGMAAGEQFCHAFMGVCGTISANELLAGVTELDDLLKQNKMPAPGQFEHLQQLLQQLMGEIDGLPAATDVLPAAALERDKLLSGLATLATLLENDMGEAESLLEKLRAGVAGGEAEQAVAWIAASVDSFAIDEALFQINTLLVRLHTES